MIKSLKSPDEIDAAIERLTARRARLHPDARKNWDMNMFTELIAQRFDKKAAILDVGCVSSPLLYNLATMGYTNLHGIDFQLTEKGIHVHPNVAYAAADLTRTPYKDASFDCITSLSVVEHGVDAGRYFAEMSRLLKPGGVLLTSTDYWPEKISTWNVPRRLTFGLPWNIFSREELRGLLADATRCGFALTGEIDDAAGRRVIRWPDGKLTWWLGKAYTFVVLGLQKTGEPKTRA